MQLEHIGTTHSLKLSVKYVQKVASAQILSKWTKVHAQAVPQPNLRVKQRVMHVQRDSSVQPAT